MLFGGVGCMCALSYWGCIWYLGCRCYLGFECYLGAQGLYATCLTGAVYVIWERIYVSLLGCRPIRGF